MILINMLSYLEFLFIQCNGTNLFAFGAASSLVRPHSELSLENSLKGLVHKDWQWANTTARCYILVSVTEHLQKQLDSLECVSEIIQTLDKIFAKSSYTARQEAIEALMNTCMTGGSVRDHCLKMMAHNSTAEMMGAKLEQEMKIDMILESLSDSFSQFKMNYNMNNLKLTPVELMHELESAERSLGKQGSAYHAESSSKPKGKPKSGKKNKKQKRTGPAVKPAAMKKSIGKRFRCGQKVVQTKQPTQ
nr:uncharacterized protein LOC125421049 [Ziziphus jujuba var. spinosa]